MSRDDRVVLDVVDGHLGVDGPDHVVDTVATALATDKVALQMVVDVLGPVTVVSAGMPSVWPPRGGFVPAWRRVSPMRPLVVLPSEQVLGRGIDPFTAEPPTAPCPTCTVTRTSVPSERIFDTGPWQTCSRCGGRRWRSTGEECAVCGPPPGHEAVAAWARAGSGWSCSRCHPPAPTDDTRTICGICGGKGRCRPDHDVQLRRFGERLLRRTRSAAKQETIRAALAALPAVDVSTADVSRPSRVAQSSRPALTTTTRLGKEVTWGTPQADKAESDPDAVLVRDVFAPGVRVVAEGEPGGSIAMPPPTIDPYTAEAATVARRREANWGEGSRGRTASGCGAGTGSSASEHPDLAVLRAELAVRAAAREAAIAWREAAMRAQLEPVRSGGRIPFLRARPGFHVPVPNSGRGDRSDGPLDPESDRPCQSCGEPSRFPNGRCDPCWAATLRVVSMEVVVRKKGLR